ncbi:MAG: septation protein A, partial [Alphaproteobacteria bacterium]|nr:septation protein A [Alphaproteobacteria bacterium]
MSEPNSAPKGLRFAVDYGPLLVFFVTYYAAGIMWATAAIMAATAVMLGVSWYFERRLAPLPLVTAGLVAVFGGLTLLLADETFIKMKPTIVKAFIA